MRYCIPVLGDRIAPRCTIAEALLFVTKIADRAHEEARACLRDHTWLEITELMLRRGADTLVCGGLSRESRSALYDLGIAVIDNVATQTSVVLQAIAADRLHPGFGLELALPAGWPAGVPNERAAAGHVDCLACEDRICLAGRDCRSARDDGSEEPAPPGAEERSRLMAAADLAGGRDHERCRLTELVAFCREMGYRRLGIAFCLELETPTRILVDVLRRHVETVPVWCKVGGHRRPGPPGPPATAVACNPCGQAELLNAHGCDFNVAVGLCLGADCLFAAASRAPVTTLLVKDRALAHNPIGALYADRYLQEAGAAPADR